MGWSIHGRAELAAIEMDRMAALLHPFHDENVFFENAIPKARIFLAQGRITGTCRCLLGCVKQGHMLDRAILGDRLKHNAERMVALHTDQCIWVQCNVFTARFPFGAQVGKIREHLIALTFELAIDQCSLPREMARIFDVVVIFKS